MFSILPFLFCLFQEKEARTNLLREKARSVYDGRDSSEKPIDKSQGHINFFEDLEKGDDQLVKANKEYEKEKKDEIEKYEKQIGYLTYLGQDTNEITGNVSWYNKLPDRDSKNALGVSAEKKVCHDPLTKINLVLGRKTDDVTKRHDSSTMKKEKKHKRKKRSKSHRSSSSSNSEFESKKKISKTSIEELRAKRLKRENDEKLRAAMLLAKFHGDITPEVNRSKEPVLKQKYSSQFNPHLAKQNSYT